MRQEQKVIRAKVGVLELAKQLGNTGDRARPNSNHLSDGAFRKTCERTSLFARKSADNFQELTENW